MRLRRSATRITFLSILSATGCGGRSGLDGLSPTASVGGLSSFEGTTPNGGSPPSVGTTSTSDIDSTGGMTATGGSRNTGGSLHTGGIPSVGGAKATGGTLATGGTATITWGLCNVMARGCNPGDKGIAGPDGCPDGGTCYEVFNPCDPPIWCVASASGTGGTGAGSTNTGGAVSTGGADDGGSSTGMFACGDQFCSDYAQYCVQTFSDVDGAPDDYSCAPMPQSCFNQLEYPSCDCVTALACGCRAGDWCGWACSTVTNPGELVVTCPGG